MNLPGLYLDEDVQSIALIASLRALDLKILTTGEARMSTRTDEDQLRFATAQGLVLVTSNVADFAKLHGHWLSTGQTHAGIILVPQQKWGPGEIARRIVRLLAGIARGSMQNRLEFLSSR